jgi:Fe-S-cluster-containing dehydrogenase component/DMSO reductase anchor subunit
MERWYVVPPAREVAGMIQLPIVAERASGPALIAELLEEQQLLSAVDKFSQWHTNGVSEHVGGERTSARHNSRYRSLLPATPPGPGQQYAFEVDLDRCSGCKACVVACHTLNGLDENETWRDVGLLIGGSRAAPVMQHVTAACHHCLQPACMIACPVNAYEKDPITGIVKHLDDQCFGCQYCTLACPYDVPKYHAGKGIVRKCDMCSSRLAVGEPPACVQSCPHEAISIRLVDREQVVDDAETSVFLPAAPDPQITLPTTTYKTRRPSPRNLLPADYFRVNSQHAHWPLVVMLVLTQLSVGAFVVGLALENWLSPQLLATLRPLHAVAALGFGLLALGSSLLHLGRPQYAFRAVLGLRHSWLSREIVAFGAFAALATLYSLAVFVMRPTTVGGAADVVVVPWIRWLGWSVALAGVIAVFCSTMIYVFTQRECWSFIRVGARFTLTCAILGVAAIWLSILASTLWAPSSSLFALAHECGPTLCRMLVTLVAAKLTFELAVFRHLSLRNMTPLKRSALLMTGDLSNATLARFALGVLGGVILPLMLVGEAATLSGGAGLVQFVILTGLLFAACLAGELLERYLFFTACAAPQMPGGIR